MTGKELTRRATEIIGLARSHGISLATAESCTAGAVAQLLAQGEGASDIFHGGFITYTKANKTAALGVPVDLLDRCSAVSAEVAASMAAGALLRCPADIVLSVSGVMGPEPDKDGNPVGLVYLALASRRGAPIEERHHFPDASPGAVRDAIWVRALELLASGIERQG